MTSLSSTRIPLVRVVNDSEVEIQVVGYFTGRQQTEGSGACQASPEPREEGDGAPSFRCSS